jgi:glutamate synthase (NADPH/NADH) small chain
MAREREFLDQPRQDVSYRPVSERLKDFRSVDMPLTDSEIHGQASRCMDCGTPFCHGSSMGCPLGNIIPEFNEAAYNGHWKEALDLLLATDVFPEFTGRICPAPCEGACVLGLIRPAVNICKIELAIIERGFSLGYVDRLLKCDASPQECDGNAPEKEAGSTNSSAICATEDELSRRPVRSGGRDFAFQRPHKAEPRRVRRAERVAVVGSGPAGLATAQVLNRAGYNVTVYEKAEKPGGLLRYGIPDFKLEKWVVDRRIDLMAQEGVQFQCGVSVGDDISYKYLRDRYEAIVLAGGAGVPRDLAVPGRELGGIHFAMEFLTQQNRLVGREPLGLEKRISAAGKNVVVIGGGDTGSDCIGTARRQGAAGVVQFEILPEPPATRSESTPWPQWPLMLRESSSHKEGAIRRWNVDTTGFTGEEGVVKRIQCVEVEWAYDQAAGRICPRRVEGLDFSVDADLVLIAMGFVAPSRVGLVDALGIAKDPRGFIARDECHMTSVEGVFVTGDMSNGASLVVRAIGDGMQTARKVMAHLSALRQALRLLEVSQDPATERE